MAGLKAVPIAPRLRASILQEAVQGRLVPQDPAEGTADELLERIREERRELVQHKKARAPKGGESRIWRGADGSWYEQRGKGGPVCIDGEIPFDIPESWGWTRLGSIVLNRNQLKPTNTFCYIDISSIDNKHQRLNPNETIIEANKAPSRARKLVEVGDVLYATVRPYLHNACVIDREFSHMPIASTGFAVMACIGGFVNRYLLDFMLSPWFDSYANDHEISTGIAYPAINDGKLYRALIPVPPSAEQKRIVARVDELMPLVDRLEALEAEGAALDDAFWHVLPKSILQEAVQGRLVPQDPAEGTAGELLERIRGERRELVGQKKAKAPKGGESRIWRGADGSWYEQRGKGDPVCIDEEIPFDIPESWGWARLGQIVNIVSARRVHKSDWRTSGVPFYRAREVVKLAKNMPLLDPIFIDENLYARLSADGLPEPGDLLVTGIGTIGTTYIVKSSDRFYYKDASVLCFENRYGMRPEYLQLIMKSPMMLRQILDSSVGTTVATLTMKNAVRYLAPVPPLAEQERIAARVDELMDALGNVGL